MDLHNLNNVTITGKLHKLHKYNQSDARENALWNAYCKIAATVGRYSFVPTWLFTEPTLKMVAIHSIGVTGSGREWNAWTVKQGWQYNSEKQTKGPFTLLTTTTTTN